MHGKTNEFEFVLYLNGKKIRELSSDMRELVLFIFNNKVNLDDSIKAWKNHWKQKTDVFIKINNMIRGISIKEGAKNSVHVEPISSFIHFLIENKIPKEVVENYLYYHYADGTKNGSGLNRVDVNTFKVSNVEEINLINQYFNDKEFLTKIVDRFILKGTNSIFKIDALVFGDVYNFVWASRKDIENIIVNYINEADSVHFGPLYIQPQARNLNYNPLYEKKRYCVQIKWYSLYDDIYHKANHIR